MFKSSWSKVLGGVVLGAVGVPFLKSDIAKTAYKYATAGVFIARDRVLEETEHLTKTAKAFLDHWKKMELGILCAWALT